MDELDGWATGRLLSAAARLVEHEWNTHLSRWDLNHASIAVLHVLLAGPQTQRELAAAVQVEDQTMSRTVERLERSGYIERRRDDADRRRVVVTITPQGRQTCLHASDMEVAEGFFHGGVDDVPALRASLAGLIRHLSRQRWPDAAPPDAAPPDAAPPDAAPPDAANETAANQDAANEDAGHGGPGEAQPEASKVG